MSEQISNNKRIAKNTLILYFRMGITLIVSLYTSRVILAALGVEDYGIYNVVGGFVSLFSLVSGSIQASVGRFLTFELGRGDMEKLKKIFSMSLFVMLGLSVIIVLLTETIGLWYLHNKMVIPSDRMYAANWCFQTSVIAFVLSMLNTPYSSAIVAHERMGMYAYLSILDVLVKLVVCLAVVHSPIDKLISYSVLLALWSLIKQVIYIYFCKRYFAECSVQYILDKGLFKEIFSFAGWNFIGGTAVVLRTQGASLLLNWFGGPIVNAANGIANSVSGIVSNFVSSFTQAFSPQITKRYAAGEYEDLMTLLIYGSKFSFYLMWIIALPLMLNSHYVLHIWLGQVPEHTVGFIRWTMVFLLSESISNPLVVAKNANGNIKIYQIIIGGILLLMLPLSYIAIKLGLPVESVAACNAITAIIASFVRMYLLRGNFPCWSSLLYFKKVFLNVLAVSLVSAILPCVVYKVLPYGIMNLLLTTVVSIICVAMSVLYIGCNTRERSFFFKKLQQIIDSITGMLKK